jgi:excisionase family DNA binding protein
MVLLYRPEEAAGVLGIGRSKLFELIGAGRLETVKIGRSTRIPAEALERFVRELRDAS